MPPRRNPAAGLQMTAQQQMQIERQYATESDELYGSVEALPKMALFWSTTHGRPDISDTYLRLVLKFGTQLSTPMDVEALEYTVIDYYNYYTDKKGNLSQFLSTELHWSPEQISAAKQQAGAHMENITQAVLDRHGRLKTRPKPADFLLAPELNEDHVAQKEVEIDNIEDIQDLVGSTMFKCLNPACKEGKIVGLEFTAYRRADEGMVVSGYCAECGKPFESG